MRITSTGWRRMAVLLAVAGLAVGACGDDGDDEASGTGGDAAVTTAAATGDDVGDDADSTDAAPAPSSGSDCDSISDAEAQSVFGAAIEKETAGGGSCNITAGDKFATIKFESGTLENARETIEESFEVETQDVDGLGDGAFKFDYNGVIGVMVIEGGRIANVAGNVDADTAGKLALAMLRD